MTPVQGSEMKTTPASESTDFSLLLGGPLFQLYRRVNLAGDKLEFVHRRVLVVTLFAWLPLLFLSVLEGRAFGGAIQIPFLFDYKAHVQLLIALPMLIAAEVWVHRRISPLVRRLVERRIVATEDLPKLNAAMNTVLRVRSSAALEASVLLFVYTLGLHFWRNYVAFGAATWYALPDGTGFHFTLAGYWLAFVSIPIFQFNLLLWMLRLLLWFWLLWRISRLNLHLTAAHPDRAGGIGFLGRASCSFAWIFVAQGAWLAGLIANRILYEGRSLLSFKVEAAALVGVSALFVLGPLVMFAPLLDRTRRKGAAEYGLLANRFVFQFEEKWIRGSTREMEDLFDTEEVQSLADLGNTYAMVREMRIVPFGIDDVTRLAAFTAAPLFPLVLTTFSLEELVSRFLKTLF